MTISIIVSDPLYKDTRTFVENISDEISGYSHELRSIGGFWSASITINDHPNKIEEWIERGVGRHVEVYSPSLVKIWEGFVSQVTAQLNELQFSVGPLLNIGNDVRVTYSTVDTSVNPPILGVRETTSAGVNVDSQLLYGTIEKVYGINGASQAQAEAVRDAFLTDPNRAFPATSRDATIGATGEPQVRLECLGYWHWLAAYYYSVGSTGTSDLSDVIEDALAADPNGIISTDYSKIATNTLAVTAGYGGFETAESILKRLNSLGDSSNNAYIMGIYRDRTFRYEQTPIDIEYQFRLGDNLGVTDKLDGEVKPWDVLPGKWLFYPDFLVGRNIPVNRTTLGKDPRAGFIESVRFTAPRELNINGVKLGQLDQLLARQGVGGVA